MCNHQHCNQHAYLCNVAAQKADNILKATCPHDIDLSLKLLQLSCSWGAIRVDVQHLESHSLNIIQYGFVHLFVITSLIIISPMTAWFASLVSIVAS